MMATAAGRAAMAKADAADREATARGHAMLMATPEGRAALAADAAANRTKHHLVNKVLSSNAAPSVTHNSGGNTMENSINVHLPPGSSDTHAGMAVAQEIRRQIVISTANSGYA
jgi:hypothetical protein